MKDRILALAYDTNAPTKLELLKLMNVSLTEVMDRHLWGVILATPLLALLNDDLYEISCMTYTYYNYIHIILIIFEYTIQPKQ